MSVPGTAPLPAALLLLLAAALHPTLATAETLAGQVLPPDAAARVELWPACASPSTGAGEAPAAKPLATVRPGKDGRFQIEAPAGEPLRLRVEAEGYLPAERWIGVGVGSDPELPPLRLRPAEDLELALAGPDGQPLAGLPLQLHPGDAALDAVTGGWLPPVQHAVTGPDGRARFRRAAGDSPDLFVAAPRLLATHHLAAGSPQRLVLAPGRPVTLKATDPRGRPAPGARVLLDDGFEIGRTGADGRLELAAPAEAVFLTVAAGAGMETPVTLGPGSGRTLDAALRPPLEYAGHVVDAGSREPIAGASVDSGCRAVARSAADGSFHLAVSGPGGDLVARAAGYLPGVLEEWMIGPDASPVTFALRPAAPLAVQVVDGAENPVAGARVDARLHLPSHESFEATTGAAGRVRLLVAAGAQLEVTAEHPGFAPAREVLRTPAAGEPPLRLRLVLTRGAAAFGRLITGEGEPLAGGTVSLQPIREGQWMPSPGKPHREAAGGPDGRFELRHLAPGRYQLAARAPGRVEAIRRREVAAGEPRVDLGDVPLAPGVALEGRVLDERDRPLADAFVTLSEGRGTTLHAESGADGAFRLADLEPGRVRFRVARKGYVTASLDCTLPAAEPLAVRLRPARTLAGRVVGPRGEPAAEARIQRLLTLTSSDGGTSVSGDGLAGTDREGRFRAEGLEPGLLTLAVEAAGYLVREVRVEIPADRDPAPLEIALETGAVLEGRVLAAGRPVPGAEVRAHANAGAGPPAFPPRVRTDAEGRFHLAGLATGHHWVVATEDGRRAQQELEVQPGTQQLDLHLVLGGLAGRVVDGAGRPVAGRVRLNGQPAAGLEVRLEPEGGATHTGADGAFALHDLAPRTYTLQVTVHPGGVWSHALEIEADRQIEIDVPTGELAGQVLSPAGPVAGARVTAEGRHGDGSSALTGNDGAFRLRLLPGRYHLRVRADGFADSEAEVDVVAGGEVQVDSPLP